MNANKNLCQQCGTFNNRGVSIDAIIVENSNILLIKRAEDPFKGYWALPGGYVEWDETVEEAVAREVKEEVGLTVESCTLIGVYSKPDRHIKQAISIVYSVKAFGKPKAGDDAEDCKWFPVNNLPENLAFDHEEIISNYSKKKFA